MLAASLLAAGPLSSAQASHRDGVEECPEDADARTTGCVSQNGDNETDISLRIDGTGGDGLAGTTVFGGVNVDNSNITVNNSSQHADGRGGDADVRLNVTARSGPSLVVEGAEVDEQAVFPEINIIQEGPQINITLEQVNNPVGQVIITNTISAPTNNTVTGTAIITQTVVGTGTNEANVGQGGLNINSCGNITPPFFGFGFFPPSDNNIGDVTCQAGNFSTITQTATGIGSITNTNTAIGVQGPINQTGATITNTIAPVIDLGTNTNIAVVAPIVNQTQTVVFNFTGEAPGGARTSGTILQAGDNETDFRLTLDLAGGDGLGGSLVMGLVGANGSTINASNSSIFADGRGGDADARLNFDLGSGPDVLIDGGTVGLFFLGVEVEENGGVLP